MRPMVNAAPSAARLSPPNGVLGANFNGDPKIMTWAGLEQAEATWVRGFAAMPDFDEGDKEDSNSHLAVDTLLGAVNRDYGAVLSLKFPYFPKKNEPIPRPGTEEMKKDLARVDAVLTKVMGEVDLLVIGNEPFIECPEDDRTNGAINDFYEAVAQHVIDYRTKKFPDGCKTVLYMGALNYLDDPKWIHSGTERWMKYVRETPEIEGTDIHPHVNKPDGAQVYLDYILPRLGDKKFLATEFSLVHLWGDHLEEKIPAAYAQKYKVPADTEVWQVIRNALDEAFPKERWYDFLRESPWFEGNKHYLSEQMAKFRATEKLAVATYGIGQDAAMSENEFTEKSTPWLLNSIYASATVRPEPNGHAAPNYAWLEDFKRAQTS
ncbi:hypothetical protein FHU35_11511 [Saccharopolyspora dendranthemae]|uniref:Uncharacterized protein n=1 Tax=Saccharopolyspora dendranthemae TaxID=1181886 RepID=A0A561V8E6_9PSEU|nr:hypothetical protein FHU35_11511 [Saccharopolyspora dendranthemae]